ncbi:MAG: YihY/virulence factor BrkB family protein [Salinivirgaceae bacterium]|jgi:membrane protein|nr:YihY/virulence factor BrkB family protein [Salinivirgaceae bacterium]
MTPQKLPSWLSNTLNILISKAKAFSIPGLQNVPIYNVGVFYINGIANGAIGVRASAISFNFFIALFPSIIFLFTLIPFIPIPDFQFELIDLLKQVLPSNTFDVVENTIVDVTTKRRGSLLSFGFIAALLFSTNGISAMIAAFNASANAFENRTWLSMRAVAILLVLIMFVLITISTGLIIFGKYLLLWLTNLGIIHTGISHFMFVSGQWLIILAFILFSISFIYYYAPSKRSKYNFFSPGSIMATLLIILSSLAFSYYLGHFGRYNKIYGSIGTLIALLIWLEITSFVLLIGFELNVSIRNARLGFKKDLELSDYSQEYERYYPKKEDLLKDL